MSNPLKVTGFIALACIVLGGLNLYGNVYGGLTPFIKDCIFGLLVLLTIISVGVAFSAVKNGPK